ncbi:hypothetical protein LTSEMON_5945 [Salmonella enterica subsp. enterica serovar Montevideo str. S5-403]|uniref:Entericidin B n=2 Tax=Salmonella enterica I TaxID=59201 RepID=G5QBK9_SALMO|nr:hypothetical protein LTSEMON_5945 [Salmonella enterica subsp. enterica serovar Montevideo str. S5-403]
MGDRSRKKGTVQISSNLFFDCVPQTAIYFLIVSRKKVIRVRKSEKRGSFVQVTNSKVVFYIHLQLIKDNILSVVICYT